jgi:hypothetical protein
MAILSFTSCQSEVDEVEGENQIQTLLIQRQRLI